MLYRYVAQRLVATIPVMAVVATFVFLLLRLTTGDPAAIIAGDNVTAQQVEEIRAKLGLDRPIGQPFVIWARQHRAGRPRRIVLLQEASQRADPRPPPAHRRAGLLHHRAGGAPRRSSRRDCRLQAGHLDRPARDGTVRAGLSVPAFVIGYALIYVFAVEFAWLPEQGYPRIGEGFSGFIERLILPSLTLVVI